MGGYFLLYESMLNTVIFARDKWLAADGVVMPDKAIMYLAAIEDGEYKREKINFWDSMYGFDMSCIKPLAMAEPLVDCVDPTAVISEPFPIKVLNMKTATALSRFPQARTQSTPTGSPPSFTSTRTSWSR